MELKPKFGIQDIKFGMTQNDVIEILGDPDRIKVDQDDDDQILLEFFKLKLRLTFYLTEGGKLGYVRTSNPNVSFNGKRIIGTSIEFAKKEIFGETVKDWEIEEYDFFITHSNDEFWLTLDEEYGTVTNIELGVTFDNDDEYNWPI